MDVQARPSSESQLPACLACSPGFLLSKLGIYAKGCFGRALAEERLRPPHYAVLALLRSEDALPQTTLATVLHIDRSDVVAIVDALEDRGLVERRRDADDRRRYALRLTEAGAALCGRLEAVAQRVEDELFEPLGDEEREQLLVLLGRLATHHGFLTPPAELPASA